MEDWLICKIHFPVKYRQQQTNYCIGKSKLCWYGSYSIISFIISI